MKLVPDSIRKMMPEKREPIQVPESPCLPAHSKMMEETKEFTEFLKGATPKPNGKHPETQGEAHGG